MSQNEYFFKLSHKRIKLILIYYCLLFCIGLSLSLLSLIGDFQLKYNYSISTMALIGSLGISLLGNTIYYIRKVYKLCIGARIIEPGENTLDELQHFGITIYFIIRPIFALGFAILVITLMRSGIMLMTKSYDQLSDGYIYTTMFFSFFCGFSTGKLLNILENIGENILIKLFDREVSSGK